MGIETVLFRSKEKKSRSEIASVLRQVAEKIEKGNLTLKQDAELVRVEFPTQMTFKIKLEDETGRRLKKSLELELEWVVGQDEGSDTGAKIL